MVVITVFFTLLMIDILFLGRASKANIYCFPCFLIWQWNTYKTLDDWIETHTLCLKIHEKLAILSLRVALLLKPLVIRVCPLKILSDYFRLFYTVNNQNLKESEKNYKGQKRFTKGFKSNATRNDKSEIFLTLLASLWDFSGSFETLC